MICHKEDDYQQKYDTVLTWVNQLQ